VHKELLVDQLLSRSSCTRGHTEPQFQPLLAAASLARPAPPPAFLQELAGSFSSIDFLRLQLSPKKGWELVCSPGGCGGWVQPRSTPAMPSNLFVVVFPRRVQARTVSRFSFLEGDGRPVRSLVELHPTTKPWV